MEPTLLDGDYILCIKPRALRPGLLLWVAHPRFGRIVKRLRADGRLESDSAEGTAAERLGPVAACEVLGRAVLAVTPSGIKLLRRRRPCSPRA